MLIPITLAMAWGLTSGTILTLVFIPPAYAIIEDWMAFLKKRQSLKKFIHLMENTDTDNEVLQAGE